MATSPINPYSHVSPGLPPQQGLYCPELERDACGVGFIAHLHGEASHRVVEQGLEILCNLTHRGATGADSSTGDGAGILMQTPDAFLRKAVSNEHIKLPEPGAYAAALVFLPPEKGPREIMKKVVEETIATEGQCVLGWRPIDRPSEVLGDIARLAEPVIEQLFVGRGAGLADEAAFERKLFVIRKVLENRMRTGDLEGSSYFHLPSLSARTLVYKGLLLSDQIKLYFTDLSDPDMVSGLALVHQRYSTNTFPTWDLAQPFRFLCHNGEINTLRGNVNKMSAREGLFQSNVFGDDLQKILPICTPGASDSAILDNALELLYHTGRSLPHAMMMLIPEAWEKHQTMSEEKKAFYEYHACFMEPWDGPASIPFTDGSCIGAVLDRNGLRPSRYTVTKDDFVIMGSETGVIRTPPEMVKSRGRLEPGRMLLIDTEEGRIVEDEEVKGDYSRKHPYHVWLKDNLIPLESLHDATKPLPIEEEDTAVLQRLFGYTLEDFKLILKPMVCDGREPTGSMGNDAPLAILSEKPQLLYNYFKQLFAQVTNPPLDAIREELVTALISHVGPAQDLFNMSPAHARKLRLEQPILTNRDMQRLREQRIEDFQTATLSSLFPAADGAEGLRAALDRLVDEATQAVDDGYSLIILSDRGSNRASMPIPALLAVTAVHQGLTRCHRRTQCGLIIESGEPHEIHHFALLLGYGVSAINPYLALDSISSMWGEGLPDHPEIDTQLAEKNYIKAISKGLLKVMSKMGISTLKSYRGAMIFEAVGLAKCLIDEFFPGTTSRIQGMDLAAVARETLERHTDAYPERKPKQRRDLPVGGKYQWRRQGERHLFNPLTIAKLQQAVRKDNRALFQEYEALINKENRTACNLRGLLNFVEGREPVPLDEVEPWTDIVKRFKTGAMSYGSISREAHETLAVAMNRIGGKSNSGEGGEDPKRYRPFPDGAWRRSAIKQVASGRFGVTSNYLVNASEIQIKMAQGAKPGEGGQLPGYKVYPWIAKTRYSTPYVTLISPPPHHDIYSIEDLAQLIHDLKNANAKTRINVKLVSEVGVGIVAAGVAKGKADVVLISGHDGGTGASPRTSIMHAGLPWELGVAETQQTLVLNGLRNRIVVECDGKLLSGRDIAVACLLGAEEFGFATSALVAMGCVMMRVCHSNTCPVGIATQDPELRRKFSGKPEHVVNFFRFLAESLREIMADLGFRTLDEMVGQSQLLEPRTEMKHWKHELLDLSTLLYKPEAWPNDGYYCTTTQDHGLDKAIDHELIKQAAPALLNEESVQIDLNITNTNRTTCTMLSSEISRYFNEEGLPDDTISISAKGSAGQSFCAFGAKGLTVRIAGDANDYLGKGLSGGKIIVQPPAESDFIAEDNVLIGNVALYGATRGEAYIRGKAGERFAVRNSGATAVVEGVGDHGCEYMTGGRVVVLGPTGRNFAAGMSGGVAYILDESQKFAAHLCNMELVDLEDLTDPEDVAELKSIIQNHLTYTGSSVAARVLDNWDALLPSFIKIMPRDYKRALECLADPMYEEPQETPAAIGTDL